ncbi:MAG: acyl-[acyl-carrier-protein]--UDP-N-acetylglucosamine O-acyltransferase [Armatimonadetes bacterium RBG_16_58_9]|nr:MAG: acyl-[acyl-carrier-protein]--UDP-N-acetylglucosamine O-acyltransferase [Armatimonadetes bacterium RBG_16_58_9]
MQNIQDRTDIHSTALVDPSAEIGIGVAIGAYSVIGENVRIGDGTRIDPHVVIECNTTLGRNCSVMSGAVLGGAPQDYKFKGERTYLRIGDNNVIREFVTIHRASGEGESTVIGDNNMLMAYCHIGHNCDIGGNITMANYVGICGHVLIEDRVVFGGIVGVHQKVRVGKLAMVGGFSKVVQDVPPFSMTDGRPAEVCDLNVIGLRRSGVSSKVRADLKQAYKLLYRSDLNPSQALEAIESQLEPSDELTYLLDFIRNIRHGFRGRQLEAP